MTIAGTYSRVPMSEAFSVAVDELEGFLSRLTRADAVLRLERESGKHWIVMDLANPRVLSERSADWPSVSEPAASEEDTTLPMAGRLIPRSESTYEPTVMIRASRDVCERFMVAFTEKHPGSRIESSGRGPNGASLQPHSEATAGLHAPPASPVPSAGEGEPTPLPDSSSIVLPLRLLEPLDEEGVPA